MDGESITSNFTGVSLTKNYTTFSGSHGANIDVLRDAINNIPGRSNGDVSTSGFACTYVVVGDQLQLDSCKVVNY